MLSMGSIKITSFLHDHVQDHPTVYLPELCWKSAYRSRVFETGNSFRESAEVTHTLPPACVCHSCSGWFLIIGNLRLFWFLPEALGCYSLMESVISVGVDDV